MKLKILALFGMANTVALTLKEGDQAPFFSAETQSGGRISLDDFRGRNVLLFFYPRDNTPGCTKEACGFRDHFSELEKRGVVILGVSTDSVKSHAKFARKYSLPFPLLADPEQKIVRDYGVWGEKLFMGRRFMGTHRVSFLIGADGRIRKIWPKVKPEAHAREVLQALAGS